MLRKSSSLFAMSLMVVSLSVYAKATPSNHIIIAPQCLLQQTTGTYQTLAKEQSFALIALDKANIEKLSTAKHHQKTPCGGFIDVTREWQTQKLNINTTTQHEAADFLKSQLKPVHAIPKTAPIAYKIKFPQQVNSAIKAIDPQKMWANLTTLTEFPDRYADSKTGVETANWLKDQIESIAKQSNNEVTVSLIDTNGYDQPSVVAKWGNSNVPGVVIGGHMDTLSKNWFGNKPGADDDGTGTVTVLEVARVLMESGMKFKKPIYFMWYAAEEMGLVGSKNVVHHFKNQHIPVQAAMQFDMTGYVHQNDMSIYLLKDYVNTSLTAFVEKLIKAYVHQPVNFTQCGYGCSDHASWHAADVPAVMPFETSFGNDNPNIHSSEDKMSNLSLEHMHDFVKLGVAYVVEVAEPII